MQETGIIRLNIHGTKHMEWKEGLLVPLHYALSKVSRFARLPLVELDLMTMISIEIARDSSEDVGFEIVDTAFKKRESGKKLFHLILPRSFLSRPELRRCKEVMSALIGCVLLYSNSLLTIKHKASNPVHEIVDNVDLDEVEDILDSLYRNLVRMSDRILDVSSQKKLDIDEIMDLPNSDSDDDFFLLSNTAQLILLDDNYLSLLSDYIYLDANDEQDAENRELAVTNRASRKSRR